MRKAVLLFCVALVAGALAAVSPAQARPALGVNIQNAFDPVQVADVEALHPDSVRTFVQARELQSPYAAINPAYGQAYKDFVARMNAQGIAVQFVILGSPGGAAPNSAGDPGAYTDFMVRFASLFKGTGTSYELWNEPDEDRFWTPQPSQAAYAALVKAAYPAIKNVDPTATVVLGPTTANNYDFISDLYKLGIKGYFDAVAVHTDTACLVAAPTTFYRENNLIGRYSFLGYKEVRAVMLANGDDKPIWMSEFGWSATSGGPTSCTNGKWAGTKPSGVSPDRQAEYLTSAVRCMSQDSYLRSASWFVMRNAAPASSLEFANYGLIRADGSQTPAYAQMSGLLRGTIASTGKCADLNGPKLRIVSPRSGKKHGNGRLVLKVKSSDPSGIKSVRFFNGLTKFATVNKAKVVKSGKTVTYKWRGIKCQKRGRLKLSVDVLDKLGNRTTKKFTVKKTAKPAKGCKR